MALPKVGFSVVAMNGSVVPAWWLPFFLGQNSMREVVGRGGGVYKVVVLWWSNVGVVVVIQSKRGR